MNSPGRSAILRPRAIFPWRSLMADWPSLPGLNALRSSSSAEPTSARQRRRGPCVPPALRRSSSCAAGWSNGPMPACRSKAALSRQRHRRIDPGVLNMQSVYLDYNASTPIDPAVAAAMRPFLEDHYGNPSSGHWAAAAAKVALETARGQVAALLRCRSDEIVFTSGGSEANNLALKGVFFAHRDRGDHIITTRTILISIMHANNEVGTIQPIEDCARIAHERGVPFHTDAAQSVGKVATEVNELGLDLLSIAGHKAYAPKGVGALFVRAGVSIEPLLHGGGHEHGRRASTESVLLAAGLGKACELARDLAPMERVRVLRDRFWEALQGQFGNRVRLNGHSTHRLPNTLNVSFVGRIGAEILERLDGVAASTGSACHSGRIELSPVLEAMSVTPEVGMGAIRFLGVRRRARTSTSLSSV